jgi:hypothetical protein
MRFDVLSMNFRNTTNTKDTISCVFLLTNSLNKNNYLNFAKTKPSVSQSRVSEMMGWDGMGEDQFRSEQSKQSLPDHTHAYAW